jgi:hypothetical protein
MANALEGNFEALQRVIPELKNATTEAEKMQIANDFLERGYKQQTEQLDTIQGSYDALKGRMGDAWEEVGKGIAQSGELTKAIQWAGEKVKAFGQAISDWIGNGGIGRLMDAFKVFFLDLKQRFEMSVADAQVFFGIIRDTTAFQYLSGVATTSFDVIKESILYLAEVVKEAWNAIKSGGRDAFEPPDTGPMKQAARDVLEAIKGDNIEATKHYDDAIKRRDQLAKDHASQVVDLNQKITEREKADFEARTKEAEKSKDVQIEFATTLADANIGESKRAREEAEKEAKALAKEVEKQAKLEEAAVKAAEAEKEKARTKAFNAAMVLAGKLAAEVIDDADKEKARAKDVADEDEKMERLKAAVKRGVRLGTKQQAQLDAWEEIQTAKKTVGIIAADDKAGGDKLVEQGKDVKDKRVLTQEEFRKEVAAQTRQLTQAELDAMNNIVAEEETVISDRVDNFIEGNKKREYADDSALSGAKKNLEELANARDQLFPEAISTSVGDNIGGAVEAARQFKQDQLDKMDEMISTLKEIDGNLQKNLELSK